MARVSKMNGWTGEFNSSFLSCEKDTETILKKLFIDSRPYSDYLKRLLLINTKDCISDMTNPAYTKLIRDTSLVDMREQGYIRLEPRISLGENESAKSYLIIAFDGFEPNIENPYWRDCTLRIDIICNTDCWDIGDFKLRPLKIAGYVDGILNGARLSGFGKLNFIGCNEIIMSEQLTGYSLTYCATHGVDDIEDMDIETMYVSEEEEVND